jgi:L-ornithine Nalpha-acyltransferase
MVEFRRGRYRVRTAATSEDIGAALALRHRCFRGGDGDSAALDRDAFDEHALHVLIEEVASRRLVGCYRLTLYRGGAAIAGSYSGRFYDLASLAGFEGNVAELGRFCIDPEVRDPNVLRLAWGALAAYVEANAVRLLFGCSSFRGTEAEAYLDAFALLKEHHLAPARWRPRVKAPRVFRFARHLSRRRPDRKAAMKAMPPLLKSYLALGGWVSDHAVVDRDLGTLHVFTGLEIAAVPAERARFLRAGGPLAAA